jgi:hypothetical protein
MKYELGGAGGHGQQAENLEVPVAEERGEENRIDVGKAPGDLARRRRRSSIVFGKHERIRCRSENHNSSINHENLTSGILTAVDIISACRAKGVGSRASDAIRMTLISTLVRKYRR